MSTISTFPPPGFPPAIRSYVGAFVVRRRAVLLMRAAGAAVAVALTWIILVALADRALQLSGFMRRILLLGGAALVIAILLRGIQRHRSN